MQSFILISDYYPIYNISCFDNKLPTCLMHPKHKSILRTFSIKVPGQVSTQPERQQWKVHTWGSEHFGDSK